MSREVALAYTAVKKVHGKEVLKETKFSSCVRGIYIHIYLYIYKIYFSTIGSILNNAKDWDGHRLLRRKKSTTEVDEQWLNYYVDENQILRMMDENIATDSMSAHVGNENNEMFKELH
ncbi:hypothetical protein ALC60_04889 [Trachymyrmex zeteki]|uniref:Uncharacterized protein n=1 Tax=Mycetomoellerius zeteki TaxID=64791 RepID=A0A151X7B5_9HYME|nr:hypothetical protein ALC60_04889 [Trachymyrmex zeteki]